MIVVLILMAVVSLLAVGASQIALQAERGSRFERDYQIAFQAAEAALLDAEFDIRGPNTSATSRVLTFANTDIVNFIADCGSGGIQKGLCDSSVTKPAWQTVDFLDDSENARTVAYGDFTGRAYSAGSTGIRSARAPRYIIEYLRERSGCLTASCGQTRYVYRITAMGFGPNLQTKVVLQQIFRKENT